MKKIYLYYLLALFTLKASAQLPDGSIAPDFTVTDIYGQTHTLSTYLNQGKHVLLEFSATWCPPCWDLHELGRLQDFSYRYGPEGSDDAIVLSIYSETVADLYGTGSNTLGNYVEGTSHPLIIAPEVKTLYNIASYPHVFLICPQGTLKEIWPTGGYELKLAFESYCGTTFPGVANFTRVEKNSIKICDDLAVVKTDFRNLGNNIITEVTLALKENSTIVATTTYSEGSFWYYEISPNGRRPVTFPAIIYNAEAEYDVEVVAVNSSVPFTGAPYNADVDTAPVPETGNDIEVHVRTDLYPSQITWKIKGSSGNIVASGGPYQAGVDANTTKIHFFTLPETEDCYSIELFDSNNNGWAVGTAGIKIFSEQELKYELYNVEDFGGYHLEENAFRTGSALTTSALKDIDFALYPNPTSGFVNIISTEPSDIEVYDSIGKVVFKKSNVFPNEILDFTFLEKGVYFLKVKQKGLEKTNKIILN